MVAHELSLLDGTLVVSLEKLSEMRGTPLRLLKTWERQGQLEVAAVCDGRRYYAPRTVFGFYTEPNGVA